MNRGAIIAVLLCVSNVATAQVDLDELFRRESITGINEIFFDGVSLDRKGDDNLPTPAELGEKVEVELRRSSIPFRRGSHGQMPNGRQCYLWINIKTVPNDEVKPINYAIHVEMLAYRIGRSDLNPKVSVTEELWKKDSLMLVGSLRTQEIVRLQVERFVTTFCNDWMASNKPGQTSRNGAPIRHVVERGAHLIAGNSRRAEVSF